MTNELSNIDETNYEMAEVMNVMDYIQAPMPDVRDYDLTPIQLNAAQAVLINDMTLKKRGVTRKTYIQLAADLGISHDTLQRYRALPEFSRFIRDGAQLAVSSSVPMAITRLHQLADGSFGTPSIKALEMILEMTGVYSKSQKHEISHQYAAPVQVSDAELQRIIDANK